MKKFFAILLVSLLTSCISGMNAVEIIQILNLKEPNNETPEEISKFLKTKKYAFDESVLLIDSLNHLQESSEYLFAQNDKGVAAIQLRIFDSTGSYCTSFSTCHGDFHHKKAVSEIPIRKNSQQEYINNSLSLQKELILFDLNFAQKQSFSTIAKNYKYTIVVYYTIWTNHFSEKVLKELSKFKKKHPNEVYLILANSAMDKTSKN
jgi:archaellum biogenesis ATPase FlaH